MRTRQNTTAMLGEYALVEQRRVTASVYGSTSPANRRRRRRPAGERAVSLPRAPHRLPLHTIEIPRRRPSRRWNAPAVLSDDTSTRATDLRQRRACTDNQKSHDEAT